MIRLSFLSTLFRQFFAPPFCYGCKLFLIQPTILCQRCLDTIKPIAPVHVILTKKYQMSVFAVSRYEAALKNMILAKASFNKTAARDLGILMWHYIPFAFAHIDCLVPIPLHWSRFAKRGFNQTETIAHILSKKTGKPIIHALKRVKRTKFQSDVAVTDRFYNVQDAFEITGNETLLNGKNIILIDDVMTTGATLQTAAKELLKARPKSVYAAVAARVG